MQESELEYFKGILQNRKEQIKKNIFSVEDERTQSRAQELNDEGDYAYANNNSMLDVAIVTQQEEELKQIDVALNKIANKEYGICAMCEDLIGFPRLKVKPHAIYCIDCREIVEKSSK